VLPAGWKGCQNNQARVCRPTEGCTGRPHWGDMGGIWQVTLHLERFMTSSTVEMLHTNWSPVIHKGATEVTKVWKMESKNMWSHLPCQTVQTTGSDSCCIAPMLHASPWAAPQPSLPHCANGGTNFGCLPAIFLNSLRKRLARHKITSVYMLPTNISTFHHPMRDDLELKCLGLDSIRPHKCGQVCSDQCDRTQPVHPTWTTWKVSSSWAQIQTQPLHPTTLQHMKIHLHG
jgi:hypothetical protein